MQRTEIIGGIQRTFFSDCADTITEIEGLRVFDLYHSAQIIQNDSFDENTWILSDEKSKINLYFNIEPNEFELNSEWLGCSLELFIRSLKLFLLLLLGKLVLSGLQRINYLCKKVATTPFDELKISSEQVRCVIEFLSFLPGSSPERDSVIERLDAPYNSVAYSKRVLSDFASYVEFEERLSTLWLNSDESKRIKIFPVYFWWMLTSILPLRPTEFLLIPADCLHNMDKHYELTVRRTRLKKGLRQVFYRIEKDYDLFSFRIPSSLAEMIIWYRDKTKALRQSSISTLLVPEKSMNYFTYPAMRSLLCETLKELGFRADQIHLGDTRHLSMISLIISGDTPSVCKALANHECVNMSAHYFSNMSTLTDCRVLHFLHDSIMSAELNLPQHHLLPGKDSLRLEHGYCAFYTVQSLTESNAEECSKVWSSSGGFGHCNACPHYIPDSPGELINLRQRHLFLLDMNWQLLMESIELLRKGKGKEETIDSILKRLQNSACLLVYTSNNNPH